MRRQRVSRLARRDHEATVAEVGQVVHRLVAGAVDMGEGPAIRPVARLAAVHRMIAAIRRDREVGNSVEQRNVREHAMSEDRAMRFAPAPGSDVVAMRSEEHTSELQSLMRNSYAVFCLQKNKN